MFLGHNLLNKTQSLFAISVAVFPRKRLKPFFCSAIRPLHHRSMLLQTVKNTLLDKTIYNQPNYSAFINKLLIHILLFGLPELAFKPTIFIFTALFQFLVSRLVHFLAHPTCITFALCRFVIGFFCLFVSCRL